MKKLFRSLFRNQTNRRPFTPRYTQLGSEALEVRNLMATLPTAVIMGGNLVVTGTEQNDGIVIAPIAERQVAVRIGDAQTLKTLNSTGIENLVILNTFKLEEFSQIVIKGEGGDDTLRIDPQITVRAELFGGEDNDWLIGAGGNDVLDGGNGNDVLKGGWGNDKLHGRAGFDLLFGEGGDDELFGGSGRDFLDTGSPQINALDSTGGVEFEELGDAVFGDTPPQAFLDADFNAYHLNWANETYTDVVGLASSHAALAAYDRVQPLSNLIEYRGNGDYAVRLFRNGKAELVVVSVVKVMELENILNSGGQPLSKLLFGADRGPGDQLELRILIVDEALKQIKQTSTPSAVFAALTGKESGVAQQTLPKLTAQKLKNGLKDAVVLQTNQQATNFGLKAGHSYAVVDVEFAKKGELFVTDRVKLYNPDHASNDDGHIWVRFDFFKLSAEKLLIADVPKVKKQVAKTPRETKEEIRLRVKVVDEHGKPVKEVNLQYAAMGDPLVSTIAYQGKSAWQVIELPAKRNDVPLRYEIKLDLPDAKWELVPAAVRGRPVDMILKVKTDLKAKFEMPAEIGAGDKLSGMITIELGRDQLARIEATNRPLFVGVTLGIQLEGFNEFRLNSTEVAFQVGEKSKTLDIQSTLDREYKIPNAAQRTRMNVRAIVTEKLPDQHVREFRGEFDTADVVDGTFNLNTKVIDDLNALNVVDVVVELQRTDTNAKVATATYDAAAGVYRFTDIAVREFKSFDAGIGDQQIEYRLVGKKDGYAAFQSNEFSAEKHSQTLEITARLTPHYVLNAKVLFDDGTLNTNAPVEVREVGSNQITTHVTKVSDGTLSIELLSKRDGKVLNYEIRTAGYDAPWTRVTFDAKTHSAESVLTVARPQFTPSGTWTIKGPAGSYLAGYTFRFSINVVGNAFSAVVTTSNGTFSQTDTIVGTYSDHVYYGGGIYLGRLVGDGRLMWYLQKTIWATSEGPAEPLE